MASSSDLKALTLMETTDSTFRPSGLVAILMISFCWAVCFTWLTREARQSARSIKWRNDLLEASRALVQVMSWDWPCFLLCVNLKVHNYLEKYLNNIPNDLRFKLNHHLLSPITRLLFIFVLVTEGVTSLSLSRPFFIRYTFGKFVFKRSMCQTIFKKILPVDMWTLTFILNRAIISGANSMNYKMLTLFSRLALDYVCNLPCYH